MLNEVLNEKKNPAGAIGEKFLTEISMPKILSKGEVIGNISIRGSSYSVLETFFYG